jgi:glycosyltransferase involved in cell wall biosynthesis
MPKKFLLISQVFYPDQVSTANLFTGLCALLAEDEIEVEVWSGHPSYTESARQPRHLIYKGININYLPSTNFNKRSLSGRFLNILTFAVSSSLKLLFSKEKTTVWVHTTPPFLGILLSGICSLRGRKFVYILLDVFPEGLIRLGKVSRGNLLIRLWQRQFIIALQKSEKIVAIGRDIKQYVIEICEECSTKIEYIPHWQDDNLIFPVEFDKDEFILEKGIKEKFVVQYSGNIGIWNEVRTMGKAVKLNTENVFYLFVGEGIRKEELLNEFELEKQQNVLLMPFQESGNFNNVLNASHVHLVTLKKGLEGMAVPCKIYGILASGRPVIALVPDNSEIAYVVKEENCGIVVNPDDTEGLINAIIFLKHNEILRRQMGINGRMAFEKKYTTRIAADRYKALMDNLD